MFDIIGMFAVAYFIVGIVVMTYVFFTDEFIRELIVDDATRVSRKNVVLVGLYLFNATLVWPMVFLRD